MTIEELQKVTTTHINALFKGRWLRWWNSPTDVKIKNKFPSFIRLHERVLDDWLHKASFWAHVFLYLLHFYLETFILYHLKFYVCLISVGERDREWDRQIWKWMFHQHWLGIYGRYFATCLFCWALKAYFIGQGFSGLFRWQESLEVHQMDRSHKVWDKPHGYQARCLPVINFIFIFFFISLFRFFFSNSILFSHIILCISTFTVSLSWKMFFLLRLCRHS